jgi:hypothetical protein
MSRANKFTVAGSSYIHRSGTLWHASARNDPGTTTPLKIMKCGIPRTVHRDIFLYYKPTRCNISQIYFGKELYMFHTDLLSIIRSLSSVYTAIGVPS